MKRNGRGRRSGLAFPGGRNPRSDPKLGTCPARGLAASAKRGRGTHQPPGQPGGTRAGRHRRPAPSVRAGSPLTAASPARHARASGSASPRPPAGRGGAGPSPTPAPRPQRRPATPQYRGSGGQRSGRSICAPPRAPAPPAPSAPARTPPGCGRGPRLTWPGRGAARVHGRPRPAAAGSVREAERRAAAAALCEPAPSRTPRLLMSPGS